MSHSKHVMIFGGAFDPPHKAHVEMVESILRQNQADEVWVLPVGQHPFNKNLTPAQHRLCMTQLAFDRLTKQYPLRFKVSEFEIKKEGKGYSFETLNTFSQQFPEYTFSWLIGSDNVPTFHKWKEQKALLKKFAVWVYPRTGHQTELLMPGMKLFGDKEVVIGSSTDIRNRIKHGQGITDFVSKEVEAYIFKHHLYK